MKNNVNKTIEERIGQRLRNYEINTDHDQFWKKLEGQLPDDRKKRRVFLWIFSGLLLSAVGAFTASYFFMSGQDEITFQTDKIENNDILNNEEITLRGERSILSPQKEYTSGEKSAGGEYVDNGLIKRNKTRISDIDKTGHSIIKDLAVNSNYKQPFGESDFKSNLSHARSLSSANQTNDIREKMLILPKILNLLAQIKSDHVIELDEPSDFDFGKNENKQTSSKFKAKGYFLAGSAFGSIRSANREGEALKNIINQEESSLESIGVGINIDMRLYKKWFASFGIEVNRSASVVQKKLIENGVASDIETYTVENRDGLKVKRDVLVAKREIAVRNIKHFNYYYSLRIPLMVTYKYVFGKWESNISMGAAADVYNWAYGRYSIEKNRVISFSENENERYDFAPKFLLTSRIGISRQINHSWDLDIGLVYNHELSNRYAASQNITSMRQMLSFGAGIGYRFD